MAAKRTAARLATCLLLLAGILTLASCSVGGGATARQAPSSADPVVQWIRQHALPLRSADLPIGTTLYQGTFRIYEYPTGVVQAIAPAPADTYNFTLGQAGLPPAYLLDLRTVPSGAVADWARGAGTATRLLNFGLGARICRARPIWASGST